MNGELGVIYQDNKQVGGFFDWEIEVTPNVTIEKEWREYKIFKRITTRSYWLSIVHSNNLFEAVFYKVVEGQLVLMDEGMVLIDLPHRILGHRYYIPIEILWMGN